MLKICSCFIFISIHNIGTYLYYYIIKNKVQNTNTARSCMHKLHELNLLMGTNHIDENGLYEGKYFY